MGKLQDNMNFIHLHLNVLIGRVAFWTQFFLRISLFFNQLYDNPYKNCSRMMIPVYHSADAEWTMYKMNYNPQN
jgi:hypothetical protein